MSMNSEKNAPLIAFFLFASTELSLSSRATFSAVSAFMYVSRFRYAASLADAGCRNPLRCMPCVSFTRCMQGIERSGPGVSVKPHSMTLVTASRLRRFGLVRLDRFACHAKRRETQRCAAIHRGLHQHRADLFLCHAILERALHVHRQFVVLAHRGEHADVQH